MVWANCGPHKVSAVRKVFDEWNLTVLELPPKMTDKLQVIDSVVNSPLKAAIRCQRCRDLFQYFQEWKILRLQATVSNAPLPPFSPTKPTLTKGIETVIQCVRKNLGTEKFEESMRRTFVKVVWRQTGMASMLHTAHT